MKQENLIRLYNDIRKDYKEMKSERDPKFPKLQKFSENYITTVLSHRYYRSQSTIENIVYYRTNLDKKMNAQNLKEES